MTNPAALPRPSCRGGLLVLSALAIGCSFYQDRDAGGSIPEQLRDLPLVELAVPGATGTMAFVMSGDGNWADFIHELADTLFSRGIPVVGLESREYLSRPRTADELGTVLERVLRHYVDAWNVDDVLVVGYSRGADFAPFMVNRVSPDLRARIRVVGLLSPTKMASFEFHLQDLVRYTPRASDISTIPEVAAMGDIPVLCVYGTADPDTLCPLLFPGLAEVVAQDAGHRLHRPGKLADMLIALAQGLESGASPARSR
jgi:peptidoglycan-N-acetylglucosamine deacetylase